MMFPITITITITAIVSAEELFENLQLQLIFPPLSPLIVGSELSKINGSILNISDLNVKRVCHFTLFCATLIHSFIDCFWQ